MKTTLKILLVIVSISGFFLGYYLRSPKVNSSIILLSSEDFAKACKQESRDRVWRQVNIDTVFSIYVYDGKPILYPLKVYVDRRGNIYVLDFYAPAILKFSSGGDFVRRFGKGKGQGPGEFEQPVDFSVSSEGYLYVSDLSTHLVTIFDSLGKVVKTVRVEGSPNRIVGIGGKNFIVHRFAPGAMFQKFDGEGRVMVSFGKFFEERPYLTPLDLKMYFDGSDIYIALIRGGYILSYDTTGRLRYLCETIDRFPLPEIKVTQGKEKDASFISVSVDPNSPISALDISVGDSLIYVLAGTASKKEGKVVIDVYHKVSGKYLFSFKFSKLADTDGVQCCIVSGGYIYMGEILKDGRSCVRKYRFKFVK